MKKQTSIAALGCSVFWPKTLPILLVPVVAIVSVLLLLLIVVVINFVQVRQVRLRSLP